MSTVCISSGEEDCSPPKKKLKLITLVGDEQNPEDNELPKVDCEDIMKFLKLCYSKIPDKSIKKTFATKANILKQLHDKIDKEYFESDKFNAICEEMKRCNYTNINRIMECFCEIFTEFKEVVKQQQMNQRTKDGKYEKRISKLEKVQEKIMKKIEELEEEEVDFDEEDDSSYIKLQKYKERAVLIYEKICKYKDENPKKHNLLYRKLDFSESSYSEINNTINKKFRDGKIFPNYSLVESCIIKCVKKFDISITETEIKEEAKRCFEHLGNLIQKRRKLDLYNVHSQYLDQSGEDPASKNPDLNNQLKSNKQEADKKIDEILKQYVQYQTEEKEVTLSSDSDDSCVEIISDEEEMTENS